ncbi:MAG: very short patch repair endonuclease [Candidatus Marinimicrobia bacterium]|nr:very short patch repair endonuclease [Candidatus Neomarinimicrobiota bacterium]
MDNLTVEQRRKNMRNIRSKNTQPERIVFQELRKRDLYFTKHVANVPGKPDIVFKRKKVAIFIDSDFWHGNPSRFQMPRTNTDYWEKKISSNKKRDRRVTSELVGRGWLVVRLWEYEVRHNIDECMRTIEKAIV